VNRKSSATFTRTPICSTSISPRGQVTEILPDLKNRVTLTEGREIIAYCAGKMRLHKIKIYVGDKVDVLLDPQGGKATNLWVPKTSSVMSWRNRLIWRNGGIDLLCPGHPDFAVQI
jgi:translation initiation factor IF-1